MTTTQTTDPVELRSTGNGPHHGRLAELITTTLEQLTPGARATRQRLPATRLVITITPDTITTAEVTTDNGTQTYEVHDLDAHAFLWPIPPPPEPTEADGITRAASIDPTYDDEPTYQ